MDGSYPIHPAQAMQSPFFYYNPDPQGENTRQHGHFTPHPSGQATFQAQNMYYQRPTSACSQMSYPQTAYANQMLTPVASPLPSAAHHRCLLAWRSFILDRLPVPAHDGWTWTGRDLLIQIKSDRLRYCSVGAPSGGLSIDRSASSNDAASLAFLRR